MRRIEIDGCAQSSADLRETARSAEPAGARSAPASTDYYVLSLRWTRPGEPLVTWWGPEDAGYTTNLDQAGRYSAERVAGRRSYYDNRRTTLAVPCAVADRHACRSIPSILLAAVAAEVGEVSVPPPPPPPRARLTSHSDAVEAADPASIDEGATQSGVDPRLLGVPGRPRPGGGRICARRGSPRRGSRVGADAPRP